MKTMTTREKILGGILGLLLLTALTPATTATISQLLSTSPDSNGNQTLNVSLDNNNRVTVRYGLLQPATASSGAKDILEICGSASKTIRVKYISETGDTASLINVPYALHRRSAPATGGTAVTITAAQLDVNDTVVPADVIVRAFTGAADTPGAGTTILATGYITSDITIPATLATGSKREVIFDAMTNSSKAIVLRGVNDCVAVTLNGIAFTATKFQPTAVLEVDGS